MINKGVIWVGMYVQNLPAEVAFFQEKVGLRLVRQGQGWADFDGGGGVMFELLQGGQASADPKSAEQQSVVVGFWVDNLDQAVSELGGRGVNFFSETGQYKNQRWAYFCDPEGNILELKEIRPV